MDLNYAPPQKSPRRAIYVIIAGLITTALSLLGVYLISTFGDTNIMGWHANYVIPIGAIAVGLVASSGYGIASYVTGLKIRRSLLAIILLLQFVAYFGAEYAHFASLGPLVFKATRKQITFVEYVDYNARNFAWKKEGQKGTGEALGLGGYFFVGIEIIGFALGSLIVPGVLMAKPYCELCQMYMKQKPLAVIPASVPARKVKKGDSLAAEAYNAEQSQALMAGEAQFERIKALAVAGDVAAVRQELAALKPGRKKAQKLPRRVSVELVHCRGCGHGYLTASALAGQGKQTSTTQLGKTELSRDAVLAIATGRDVAPLAAMAMPTT